MIDFARFGGQVTVMWPQLLWLLTLVPLLVAAYFWLRSRQRDLHTRLPGLWSAAVGGRSAGLRRAIPPLLLFIALFALLSAVSRPQVNMTLPSMHKDIILALDTSGSMRATDVKPNRLAAAQNAARLFVERRPLRTKIGIVSISGSASVVQSLTDNREDLMKAIERVQLQRGTALGSGIYIALATLLPDAGINLEQLIQGRPPDAWARWADAERKAKQPISPGSNRSVAIVLLSDGENTHGPDPLEAAKLAAEHGVRIYTVGIGSPEGTTLGFSGWSMRVRLDDDTMRKIAATTHGEYYAASSTPELNKIYEHLSARMVVERTRTVEVTAFVVGLGALLMAISAFCSVLWFNRVI
jgi:Ca-activated chloride channel family protein